MFLNKEGLGDKFYQYECMNISQVKNTYYQRNHKNKFNNSRLERNLL